MDIGEEHSKLGLELDPLVGMPDIHIAAELVFLLEAHSDNFEFEDRPFFDPPMLGCVVPRRDCCRL